jgi:hypothetical protein
MDAQWSRWRAQFVEDFFAKGWSGIITAYCFKYIGGSFVEYALKKICLLIGVDPELTVNSRINLVVLGLPENVRNKLSKKDVISQSALISELQPFEHLSTKFSKCYKPQTPGHTDPEKGKASYFSNHTEPEKGKISCDYCKKNNKIHWNHRSADCYLNPENRKETKSGEKKPIKLANNVTLEGFLNESIPDVKN